MLNTRYVSWWVCLQDSSPLHVIVLCLLGARIQGFVLYCMLAGFPWVPPALMSAADCGLLWMSGLVCMQDDKQALASCVQKSLETVQRAVVGAAPSDKAAVADNEMVALLDRHLTERRTTYQV